MGDRFYVFAQFTSPILELSLLASVLGFDLALLGHIQPQIAVAIAINVMRGWGLLSSISRSNSLSLRAIK